MRIKIILITIAMANNIIAMVKEHKNGKEAEITNFSYLDNLPKEVVYLIITEIIDNSNYEEVKNSLNNIRQTSKKYKNLVESPKIVAMLGDKKKEFIKQRQKFTDELADILAGTEFIDWAKVKYLIENGADVNTLDEHGDPIIMRPIQFQKKDILELMIKKDANINIQDQANFTPLMYASRNGDYDTAKLLVDKGAKLNITDAGGRTALGITELELATYSKLGLTKMSNKLQKIIALLKEHGAE